MAGIRGAQAAVTRFNGWDELSDRHRPALEQAAQFSFFRTVPWFQTLGATSLDPGDAVRLYAAGDPPAVVLPLRQPAGVSGLRPRRLTSLANFYSCDFAPLARGAEPRASDLAMLAAALRAERPAVDLVELTSMKRPSAAFHAVERGFTAAGWWVQSYFHFANWYAPTAGLDSERYLAERPPALRNTIKRKTRALERRNDGRIELIVPGAGDDALDAAIEAYERVYQASWKIGEPYPRFAPAFMRTGAAAGALRLGLVFIADVPTAAQIWIVWHGRATLCKLAHDERYKALSVGSVLTWRMMQHLLDAEHVREVDFGRGDDPYKQLWMSHRREHWGLLAFNRSTPWGLAAAARHIGGRRLARAYRRLRAVNGAPP